MLAGSFCFTSARKQAEMCRPGREKEARSEGTGPVPAVPRDRERGWQRPLPAQPRPVPQLGTAAGSGPFPGTRPWQSSLGVLRGGRQRVRAGGEPLPPHRLLCRREEKRLPWVLHTPQHFQRPFSISLPPDSNANGSLSEAAPPSPRPLPEPSLGAAGAAGPGLRGCRSRALAGSSATSSRTLLLVLL